MIPGQRKLQKNFSTKDSQEAFIAICPTETLYKEQFNAKVDRESAMPPFITIIGTLLEPETIIVDFENIMYKIHSISKAIDICIKAYHLFQMEYSPAACLMWQFISKKFYGLPDENVYPAVHMLIKTINGKLQMFLKKKKCLFLVNNFPLYFFFFFFFFLDAVAAEEQV